MSESKFCPPKTPKALRMSFANSEGLKPLLSNSDLSFTEGMTALNPLKHSNVISHTEIYSSFLNRFQRIPKRSSSIDKPAFSLGKQVLVHTKMANPTISKSKENRMPPWRLVKQEPDTEMISPPVPWIDPLLTRDELDFTPSQYPRTRFENRLRRARAHEGVILNRKYSYQMAKLSQSSTSGFNQSQKHKNVDKNWSQIMSMPKESLLNGQGKIMDIATVDFCGRRRGNNELRFRGSVNPVPMSSKASANEGNPFEAPGVVIDFPPAKTQNRIPISIRNSLHPQAQIILQPRTSLCEPQMVSRRSGEEYSLYPERQKENSSRMGFLIPTIPQFVQLNTSVQKELLIPPFITPDTTRANIHRHGSESPCPGTLKCDSLIPGLRHLHGPFISTAASRLNVQQQSYPGPELYIKMPQSNTFIPALKYQPHGLQRKFGSVPGTQNHEPLYAISNQIVRFADNPSLTFTAYIEVDCYASSTVTSENGQFFAVAGDLILRYPTPITFPEHHQFAAPATVYGNGPTYNLLSQWPSNGQMIFCSTCGYAAQVPYQQPNGFHSGNQ